MGRSHLTENRTFLDCNDHPLKDLTAISPENQKKQVNMLREYL
jgi:hypothetical protein